MTRTFLIIFDIHQTVYNCIKCIIFGQSVIVISGNVPDIVEKQIHGI
jgi:hypothetical protein